MIMMPDVMNGMAGQSDAMIANTTDSLYLTELMTSNPYVAQLLQKGYTEREIRESTTVTNRAVPAHLQDRYSSWEEYQEALHEFLNGM